MGILTGWVVTIAGVVVLVNVCEILMPEGEMNKYIKGILSIICMFVLVSPLPKLLNQPIDLSEIFGESADVNLDYSFLDYVNQAKADALAADWSEELQEEGLPAYEFAVQIRKNSAEFVIEAVVLQCSEESRKNADQAIAILCKEYGLESKIFIIHVNTT